MNSYEAKQQARRERLEAAADKARDRAAREFRKADLSEEATGIPFGQPILVGHHSERRHRRTIERANNALGRAVGEDKHADELDARPAAVGSGGVSSDDPDAVAKLRERLQELEAEQARMKAANATWSNANRGAKLWERPFPPYALSNNSANMRRIRDRIAQLERAKLVFAAIPPATVRQACKRFGFRWSRTAGAWQRHLNNAARAAAGGQRRAHADRRAVGNPRL